jgi:hypothetical protein
MGPSVTMSDAPSAATSCISRRASRLDPGSMLKSARSTRSVIVHFVRACAWQCSQARPLPLMPRRAARRKSKSGRR